MNVKVDRGKLVEEFRKKHDEAIQHAFDSGASWVLFIGNSGVPVMTADATDAIPSNDHVRELAERRGGTPMIFTADDERYGGFDHQSVRLT